MTHTIRTFGKLLFTLVLSSTLFACGGSDEDRGATTGPASGSRAETTVSAPGDEDSAMDSASKMAGDMAGEAADSVKATGEQMVAEAVESGKASASEMMEEQEQKAKEEAMKQMQDKASDYMNKQ